MKETLVKYQKQAWDQAQAALKMAQEYNFASADQNHPIHQAYYEAKGAYEVLQKILEESHGT